MTKIPTHSYTNYTGKPYIYYAGSVYDTTLPSNQNTYNKQSTCQNKAPVYQIPMQQPIYQPTINQAPMQQPIYQVPMQQPVYQPIINQPSISQQPSFILPSGELVNKDVMYLYYANVYGGYGN